MTVDAYTAVRDFVQRVAGTAGPAPAAGSPEWCALADTDPAKLVAVLTAGTRMVLEEQLDALDARRRAAKDAALEVSEAVDWSAQARRIRDRADARRSGTYIDRVVGEGATA
ncbi:DUF2742 domain-containing protein [Gordonia paraffinivorans]|uniref:DUF2742 domain-containing protein n=1 Tax=Gordonia paraffinivorans TaxID=175628 RepID=UPI003FCE05AA